MGLTRSHRAFLQVVLLALVFLLPLPTPVEAAVTLAWEPPLTNADGTPCTDLAGYRIYYDTDGTGAPYTGTGLTQGTSPITVPLTALADPAAPAFTISGLASGTIYAFVVTAYDTSANESLYSNAVLAQDRTATEGSGSGDATTTTGGSTGQTRVTSEQLVLYSFTEGGGTLIRDQANNGNPLDLYIQNSAAVTWLTGGGLRIKTPTIISSLQSAKKIAHQVRAKKAITVEAWIKPANTTQRGPARIATISSDPTNRNLTLGQGKSDTLAGVYDMRLRTTGTSANGLPSLTTGASTVTTALTHVVYTRASDGTAILYLNGQEESRGTVSGDFSNWNDGYRLALGNELTEDHPWLGDLHLVAIYGRSLSSSEVTQNHLAGARPTAGYSSPTETGSTSTSIASTTGSSGTSAVTALAAGSTDTGTVVLYESNRTYLVEADASVSAEEPARNFGSQTFLETVGQPEKIIFLRFLVSDLGEGVASATVRLNPVDSSTSGGIIYGISDNGWDENGVTFNTQPWIDGEPLDMLGSVSVGNTVAFDVTGRIDGDGYYSFAVVSDAYDGANYRSREDSVDPPVLVVTTGSRSPDTDADGIPDSQERAYGLDPHFGDSDGDGISDYIEWGPASVPANSDGPGGRIDPLDPDSDNDGLPDSEEGIGDRDGDGIPNYRDPED